VAKVGGGGGLAVSKKLMHTFHMEKFSLKKLNEIEDKEQYLAQIGSWILREFEKLLQRISKFQPKII
jgi:hypothetical protein